MNVGKAIYTIMFADNDLQTATTGGFHPVRARNKVDFPLLTYAIVDVRPSDTKTGASTVDFVRMQFDVYAEKYETVSDISSKLRLAIDRYNHAVVSSIQLDGISFITHEDSFDDEYEVYRQMSEYYVRVKRSAKTDGPANVVVEDRYVENLRKKDFTVSSGNSVNLTDTIAEVILVLRGKSGSAKSAITDYSVSGNTVTINEGGDFGEYGEEQVQVVYVKAD